MQRIDVADDTTARRLRLMHLQRLRDPLQRVPRGDLRLAASIDIAAGTGVRHRARRRPLAAQAFEPRAVHRLERQRALEASVAGRVDLPGGLERALTREIRAVALEAERLWLCACGRPRRMARLAPQLLTASRTQSTRLAAFELPARKGHPLAIRH